MENVNQILDAKSENVENTNVDSRLINLQNELFNNNENSFNLNDGQFKSDINFKDDLNLNFKSNTYSGFGMYNEKSSPDFSNLKTPSEHINIKNEDANTTNCLALTIQKEHRLVAIKNVFLRSLRMSWKVIVSGITLAIIKLLS